jgi:hypothetical protein
MKCGREIPAGQVFCDECLKDMEKYPVKPGTAIHLPPPPKAVPAKKSNVNRRPMLQPVEQVKILKQRLFFVSAMLILTLMLMISGFLLTAEFIQDSQSKPLPGQNYSTEDTSETSEPTKGA